jgi:hypothetical protein
VRTLLSVFAGYAIFVISAIVLFRVSGQDPHLEASTQFVIGSTLYGMFFAALAGYIATKLAKGVSPVPAIALCAIIAFLGGITLIMRPAGGPRWSQLATLVFIAPMALAGGLVRLRRAVR